MLTLRNVHLKLVKAIPESYKRRKIKTGSMACLGEENAIQVNLEIKSFKAY